MTVAELFADQRARAGEKAPGRRRGYRQKINSSAVLRPASGDAEPVLVSVFDLSMFGVGFSSARAFASGDVYRFSMCDRKQSASRIEVRSCRARPDGMFDVGAQFC